MTMSRLLVLGGTGFVGRALCERLTTTHADDGLRLTVPTRRRRHGRAVQVLPTVDLVEADVHDDAALAGLLHGVDAVVNLIAILHGDDAAFDRVHVALPRRLAAACRAAGVKHVLHVSALGVGPGAPSRYLRSKTAGEALLRDDPALDVTVLRPSVIFGREDRFTNLFAALQSVAPVFPLAGASARFQPVWVGDVAQALVTLLSRPGSAGQVFEAVGPTEMTLAEIVQTCGRLAGRSAPVLPLPDALARLQAGLMELAPGEPLMSRDNLDSMKAPNVASGTLPTLSELGIAPASLAAEAATWLGGRGPRSLLDRFRTVAGRD